MNKREINVRHVIASIGRTPANPDREPASGLVGAVLDLAKPQARTGCHVEVWGWNDMQPRHRLRWNGIDMWVSPEWAWARFGRWDVSWLAPVWVHAITRGRTDVLHAHADPNLLYTRRTCVRLLHLHTGIPDPFPAAYVRLLHRADAVVCCSEFIRGRFLAVSGYPAERTFVVYNGADLGAYYSTEKCLQRARWRVSDNFVVLYVGAIVQEKGLAALVRSFAKVQSAVPNATLVVVGSARLWAMPGGNAAGDAYEADVRRLAQGLNVRFAGSLPRDQMPAAYAAADVVVVPSLWDEPLGTVVCEAMAAGRPVVASRTGGICETVSDGHTGILVRPGDEDELAQAIQFLAADKDRRQHMADAARERAKMFTWEASARLLGSIYDELLREHGRYGLLDGAGGAEPCER